jgi:hypothetical protein
MTRAEQEILYGIVQTLQNQMVKFDALERVLIDKRVIRGGERDLRDSDYLQAAINDLALIRGAIANLPVDEE